MAYGEEVTELSFRKPKGIDLLAYGNPVVLDVASDPPGVKFDMKSTVAMLAALATVPPSTITSLETRDLLACAWGVAPFFVPATI
jgi:hypothetical protein